MIIPTNNKVTEEISTGGHEPDMGPSTKHVRRTKGARTTKGHHARWRRTTSEKHLLLKHGIKSHVIPKRRRMRRHFPVRKLKGGKSGNY